MTQHDLALILFERAGQDERAVEQLVDNAAISDEIVGFHLQQATEKLLKAALAELGQDVRKTHILAFLLDALSRAGDPVPQELSVLRELTASAVEYRYGLMWDDEQPLDRHGMLAHVRHLRSWMETLILPGNAGAENR
jgi:HEPN domain-containing protein